AGRRRRTNRPGPTTAAVVSCRNGGLPVAHDAALPVPRTRNRPPQCERERQSRAQAPTGHTAPRPTSRDFPRGSGAGIVAEQVAVEEVTRAAGVDDLALAQHVGGGGELERTGDELVYDEQ